MLLSELGSRLEQSVEPGELMSRLAAAVRYGLDASWVRIRLAGPDGELADSPIGRGRGCAGGAAASNVLDRSGETLGRIEVGPDGAENTATPNVHCSALSPARPRHPSPTSASAPSWPGSSPS